MKYSMWSLLVSGAILCAAMGIVIYGDGGPDPSLTMIDLNQIQVSIVPLSATDVAIEEDVSFEVTLQNNGESDVEIDLWFTVDLAGFDTEKRVSTPYLSRESPLSGVLPNQENVIIRLKARALENEQRGPYTFFARAGIFDFRWTQSVDSFQGYISGTTGHEENEERGDASDDWVINSIEAVNEAGRSFLAGAGESVSIPRTVNMAQNYPNPFNPSTKISFECRPSDDVRLPLRLDVYDIRGHLVRTLVDESKPAGFFTVDWDGRDNVGIPVTSGIYLFKLHSKRDMVIRRGLLSK